MIGRKDCLNCFLLSKVLKSKYKKTDMGAVVLFSVAEENVHGSILQYFD